MHFGTCYCQIKTSFSYFLTGFTCNPLCIHPQSIFSEILAPKKIRLLFKGNIKREFGFVASHFDLIPFSHLFQNPIPFFLAIYPPGWKYCVMKLGVGVVICWVWDARKCSPAPIHPSLANSSKPTNPYSHTQYFATL